MTAPSIMPFNIGDIRTDTMAGYPQTVLTVTFSEAVYSTAGGSGTLEASDFDISLQADVLGGATLTSPPILGIYTADNIRFVLTLGLSGMPNGTETVSYTHLTLPTICSV